ncbi:MAG: hypothetical protein L0Y71_01675 [Gemmataceae bacterium]|nr:hypothetical protein [Gemmataceae bacterium]
MRPKTLALVVGTVIAGLAVQGTFALLVMHLLRPGPRGQNGFVAAPANVFIMEGGGDMMAAAPGQQPAQPCAREELQQVRGPAVETRAYEFSGPFTHGNLSVFFIHGPDALPEANGPKFITLQEAVAQNLATVHDTGMSLTVDNRSNSPLFIQGGDIVKGGNQDRVLPYDYLIPAGANRVPVAAFCVESGRSYPRGNEPSRSFQVATEQLPTRSLKLAALLRRSQTDVWNGVSQTQANLSRNIGGAVQSPQSQTSLQLTLEHPRVQQAAQAYINELSPLAQRQDGTIGLVVAINGKVQSADVYASSDLFHRVWPKLLQASAVAAVSERQAGAKSAAPTTEAVQSFLAAPEEGQAYRQTLTARVNLIRQETPQTVLFETCDTGQGNLIVHRCYLGK